MGAINYGTSDIITLGVKPYDLDDSDLDGLTHDERAAYIADDYKMQLKMKGIELISIAEDFGQFGVFANMLEAFTLCVAEMERENIMKRTSAGRIQKAEQGGYAGGQAPMGYSVSNGHLAVNPNEAPSVIRAFELRDQGLTMRDVVAKLNEEGWPTRSGKPFKLSTVAGILNNKKTYQGYYRYGKNSEWVEGQQEAILPRD